MDFLSIIWFFEIIYNKFYEIWYTNIVVVEIPLEIRRSDFSIKIWDENKTLVYIIKKFLFGATSFP